MSEVEKIKAFAKTLSIPAVGICSAAEDGVLLKRLQARRECYSLCEFEEPDLNKRTTPELLLKGAKSVVVCLFPYYSKALKQSNLSFHAQVLDYHQVVHSLLEELAAHICKLNPGAQYRILCDTSPLSDRMLAYRAGLGFFGKNNMLIHPIYGSYFVIGSILLNVELLADTPLDEGCKDCNACLDACPGNALFENFGFDCERCISYLTQKKNLNEAQQALVHSQNSVYGCDICQKVCPHNQNLPETPIQAFRDHLLSGLDYDSLCEMSNKEYKNQYGNYTFGWRSKQTILRNFPKERSRDA